MAKKKKQQSGWLGSRLAKLFSLVATLMTGAGFGGWAYPDLPVLGSTVQRLLNATKSQVEASPYAEQLNYVARQITDARGVPLEASAGGMVSANRPSYNGAEQMVSAAAPRPASTGATISIATYNIQVFGESKLGKPDVMNVLVQIVRRFDLVAIQEVRSKSDAIIPDFVKMINADGSRYQHVIGPRLGRTNSKEQYVFVFNTDRIEVDPRSVLTIDDPKDQLHRAPLLARFRVRTPNPAQGFTFWLMNAHTDPDEVPQEVDALASAFVSVQQQGWGEDDVILLGDLNASEKQLGRLGTIPGIRYVVAGIPTNTRGNRTYDNILFDGRATVEFTGQAGVGNVIQHFGLTMDQALQVSDHFPVWATFSAYEGGGVAQAIAGQSIR